MAISVNRLDQYDQGVNDVSFVGSKIRAIRESIGYSVEDLAVTCGLANTEIAGIEAGEVAEPGQLERIAIAMQIPVESLFDKLH
ncbi:helix-turn-helix transcriptional regulator [Rhizobium sp. KVB221]|uniref:Helix-turn-helix transcriptional regulator n=1 Tax=Rhizobium setariae TaxID=2801340 RepID=A0A936YNN8_9HYPH|nr:helix-turn-helix transcriptional regulator [Rhizobium setariae]MBL0371621.1 helix-turn-helix transcriptional regulator [Rhizobium setariae]